MKAFYALLLLGLVLAAGCGGGLEKKVVGSWKVDVSKSDLGMDKSKSDFDKKMAESMAGQMSIDLRADKTYTMTMIMGISGKWALDGNKLTLTPEKAPDTKVSFGGKETMTLDVDSSGDALTFTNPDVSKTGKLVFVKSK